MPSDVCPQGHPILTSADRTGQGHCRRCHREANQLIRLRNRVALQVCQIFQEAGMELTDENGQPATAAETAARLIREQEQDYPELTDPAYWNRQFSGA